MPTNQKVGCSSHPGRTKRNQSLTAKPSGRTEYHAYESGWVTGWAELLVAAQKVSPLSARGTFGSRSKGSVLRIPMVATGFSPHPRAVSTATITSTRTSALKRRHQWGRLADCSLSTRAGCPRFTNPGWSAWRQRCDRSESHRAVRSCCGRRKLNRRRAGPQAILPRNLLAGNGDPLLEPAEPGVVPSPGTTGSR